MENWKVWKPRNDYEFYMIEISKQYIAGLISTEECNKKLERLKDLKNILESKEL